jgi:indole-3-glycerol phosphate synthase/phosphoribosylanthranilate isomerase
MFLERIVTLTRLDLEQRKQSVSLDEMMLLANIQPHPRDLLTTLKPEASASQVRLIAEVKRASPSKGLLAPNLDPVALARTYEASGASAISVLTEPHFFLGSPEYLRTIKQAVRLPILRKDFIIDDYQVYEARAWSADAILLICAILDDYQLHHLLELAHSLHMRCLVEVHSEEEARRAVAAGAMIIGINSRDLTTFQMDPYLVRELRPLIPKDRVVVAESGIHTAADARRLARYDVQAMLVGESLVVSNDVPTHMHMLLDGANQSTQVKICGLRTPEHLDAAIEAGADMLSLMFYKSSSRNISPDQARELLAASAYFSTSSQGKAILPDLVGVFVNEDADYINEVIDQVGLQFVQLHGTETPEFCEHIKRPVIKALHLQNGEDQAIVKTYRNAVWRILLDTPSSSWGGTGKTHDWCAARAIASKTPIILAGGLTPENIADAIRQVQPWGVDVSSGVETNKQKDAQKIRTFVKNVRKS